MSVHWHQPDMRDIQQKMEEKTPQGKGTVCSLVSVKINQGATTHRWRKMYGRKV